MTPPTTTRPNISLHDLIAAVAADYACGHDRATDVVNRALHAYEKEGRRGLLRSDETLASAGEEAVRLRADRLLEAQGFSNETHADRCRTVIRAHPIADSWEVTVYLPGEDVYDELRTADTYAQAQFTAALQRSKYQTDTLTVISLRVPAAALASWQDEIDRRGLSGRPAAFVEMLGQWLAASRRLPGSDGGSPSPDVDITPPWTPTSVTVWYAQLDLAGLAERARTTGAPESLAQVVWEAYIGYLTDKHLPGGTVVSAKPVPGRNGPTTSYMLHLQRVESDGTVTTQYHTAIYRREQINAAAAILAGHLAWQDRTAAI